METPPAERRGCFVFLLWINDFPEHAGGGDANAVSDSAQYGMQDNGVFRLQPLLGPDFPRGLRKLFPQASRIKSNFQFVTGRGGISATERILL